MNIAADAVGRTLARLARVPRQRENESSRDVIVELLSGSQDAMTVDEISEQTGLHPNTVRTHLDVLRAGNRVARTRAASEGRGRPKWLYRIDHEHDPYVKLVAELGDELEALDDPKLAEAAARRWRKADGVTRREATDPDAAVSVAVDALEALGFSAEASPVGDAIFIGDCPYAQLVAERPMICDIHARALEQVLDDTGQDVRLAGLDVFPRNGVCVARLKRPDITPDRIVSGT